jgi:hypothetical protein
MAMTQRSEASRQDGDEQAEQVQDLPARIAERLEMALADSEGMLG